MPYDGLVCLFSVRNDATDRDIDYDEVSTTGDWGYGTLSIFSYVPLPPIQLSKIKSCQMMILGVNFLFSHPSVPDILTLCPL